MHRGESFCSCALLFPFTMQAALKCFFFALLKTAASLECEICTAKGTNCTGSVRTCPGNKETCLITLTESTVDGKVVQTVERSCASTFWCNAPPPYFDMGGGRTYRSSWVCCTGKTCRQVTPQLPPLKPRANTTPNPSNSSCSDTYSTEMANCTKVETNGFGRASNETPTERLSNGCTTRFVCASGNSKHSEFTVGYDVVHKMESSKASQPTAVLLPSFSGLLLRRILLSIAEGVSVLAIPTTTTIMQTLLKLSLFLALVTSGASLECETCFSNATTCAGDKKTCSGTEETCIVILTESTVDGPSVTKVEKRCSTMSQCSMPPFYFTLGAGRRVRQSWVCCTDDCDKVVPVLIPVQTRSNGVMCPACHEWKESCKTEMANCTGMETSCFKITSHVDTNGTHIDRTMMGCTTKYTCAAIEGEATNFRPMSSEAVQVAECTHSTGSRSSGLLLPIFSGLLLLKIIS
uniref:uncharacterized protein LOC114602278 n=1 Tax=Podarcis muralis TaxID=64176 RepID=UPI00109F6AB3|nr:uncharacterized protein LOC114602278 [Podarcis muralis]